MQNGIALFNGLFIFAININRIRCPLIAGSKSFTKVKG